LHRGTGQIACGCSDRAHAVIDEELLTGVRAVSVPVHGAGPAPWGAISVFGPSVRLPLQRLPELAALAQAAARALG